MRYSRGQDPTDNSESEGHAGKQPHGRYQPADVARTVGEATSVQLKVVIPIAIVLIGAAFSLGRLLNKDGAGIVPSDLRADVEQLKQELRASRDANHNLEEQLAGYGLGLISSLDVTDAVAEKHAETVGLHHAKTELSIHYNTRGLRIYLAEKKRATENANVYSRAEVKRALRWFEKARKAYPGSYLPWWNSACMYGLLGNPDKVIDCLQELDAVLPLSLRSEYRDKVASDPDLCPVDSNQSFAKHLRDTWGCVGKRRCPTPPIAVE